MRYGTEQDPITFFPRDHGMVPGSPEHGYVYAATCAEAMSVDAEVFGRQPEAGR